MKIGVFGGTFDPPHTGHLILASEAQYQLALDRVLWVLTPTPPHKPGRSITSLETRFGMLSAAISGNPGFVLSRMDIDRPPPHYAVDTLRLLASQNPGAEIIYLIGGDSLRDLPTWRQPRELLQACDAIGVMRRPADELDFAALEEKLPGVQAKIRVLNAPLIQISASYIRSLASRGGPYRYYLPAEVYELIRQNGIYSAGTSDPRVTGVSEKGSLNGAT